MIHDSTSTDEAKARRTQNQSIDVKRLLRVALVLISDPSALANE